MRRSNGRAPLGSIPELPALSCHEIKASEGKHTISGKYWLDPTTKGKAKLIYCDMVNEDMDECKFNISDCDVNANCTNTYGSYKCTCKVGYIGDGRSCSDIDECKENYSCHVNAACMNALGSHVCQCHAGYTGNGENCIDIDECSNGSHDCDVNANCTNTNGSHSCTCKEGYTGKGESCQDIDECKGSHSCHVNATCTNTLGSHVCQCHAGYTGNGQNCTDIDECQKNTHDCHLNATCQNTNGSFVCTCLFGYNGDGRNCTDIDECSQMNMCDKNASCSNTQGSYSCACNPKYIGDGLNCKADPCYNYRNLSDADRKSTYITPYDGEKCDDDSSSLIFGEWYRFVGDAGTKMPTQCVPRWRCGAFLSGWLKGGHPTLADGEVFSEVCFSRVGDCCYRSNHIKVLNCGSYFIYQLQKPPRCASRYCSTD